LQIIKEEKLRETAAGVKKKMSPDRSFKYQMVDTPFALEQIAGSFSRRKVVAVDLESDSMHHYREKVCLLQIADESVCAVIDPLKLNDLSPLKPLFSNPAIQKVFHGADYDIRSLYRDFNIDIENLFDTELASRFVGHGESGLEAVLLKRFDVQLNKKFQRRDWSIRPLSDEMIEYAAKDVYYLIPLAERLKSELEAQGRHGWVEEECLNLSRVRAVQSNGFPLFLKCKGSGRLEPRRLAVLESLLQLREKIAAKKDRPLYQVFRNDSLFRIASMEKIDLSSLAEAGALSAKQIDMYGSSLVKAAQAALSLSENQLPTYPRKPVRNMGYAVRRRMKSLSTWRNKRAHRLGLDPAILLTKAQMASIAQVFPRDPIDLKRVAELKNWQRKAFGKEIVQVLNEPD